MIFIALSFLQLIYGLFFIDLTVFTFLEEQL